MAMSLPINTPSAGNSPSSDDSSNHPHTPVSPGSHSVSLPALPQSTDSQTGAGQMKRKPSRRANTAERRATHNAVERQRRETLNGRFLDLAALLPNLSQIRRPSKSSIVNSSIAHIHASRRHRQLASRELRSLKIETDALRRELNEWRNRSNLPLVEEPIRGEGFTMVLSGEIEVLTAIPDDEEENGQDYDDYNEGNDEFAAVSGNTTHNLGLNENDEQTQMASLAMLKNANAFTLSSTGANAMGLLSRGPMVAPSPTNVSFENPAMASLYEPSHHHTANQQFSYLQQMSESLVENKWNPNPSPQQQLYSMQRNLNLYSSPPSSTSGLTPPPTTNSGAGSASNLFPDSAFYATLQRHQLNSMQQGGGAMGHLYGSPIEGDDASSGSGSVHGGGGRRRSGSSSNGSNGYGTPPHASPTGSFDLSSVMGGGDTGRRSSGLHINTGGWRSDVEGAGIGMGMGVGMGMNSMMKQNLSPPISVGGGGGGGGGFMSMMF